MTTPSQDSPAPSPIDIQQVPDRFRCQTPECPNPVRVITLDLEDSSTEMECLGCCMARNLAILKELAAQGMLDLGDSQAAPL